MDLFERLKDLITAYSQTEEEAQLEVLLATLHAMSFEEGGSVAQSAIAYHDANSDDTHYLAEHILAHLVNFVPGALADVHHAILDRQMTWANGFLFLGADASVRDRMLALLDAGVEDERFRVELVCGLAWIGDDIVQQRFADWRVAPQPWETGRAKAANFTRTGGWELTGDGKRRDLYFPESYSFVSIDKATPDQIAGPVAVVTYVQERCHWCERLLVTLFDIDLTDPSMAFLGVTGERLRFGICQHCSLQTPIYWDFDLEGYVSWSDANPEKPPDDLYMYGDEDALSLSERRLVLGEPRTTLVETIARYWDPGLTQLGGLPEWVQDEAYPVCPKCKKTMCFIAQLEPVDLIWEEGIIYAFACFACGISTTNFQQT
jgi:hypothetical protein